MREIKFRGFQRELNKWVYGDLIRVPDWSTFIFNWESSFEDRIQVDSDSVGQYTGLKDKNGKEIYEGDILCWPKYEGTKNQARWVVEWNNERSEYTKWHPIKEAEVIGNIYEHPDLLTKL